MVIRVGRLLDWSSSMSIMSLLDRDGSRTNIHHPEEQTVIASADMYGDRPLGGCRASDCD